MDLVRSVAAPTLAAPTLVIDSVASSGDLGGRAAAVVQTLPRGSQHSLPGGWHSVAADLAPALIDFFGDAHA